MAITYPPNCDTPRRRLAYCLRARELLRRLHNKMGHWYNPSKPDATLEQWEKLPAKIKNRYPYAPKLTKEQWEDFQINVYIKIDNKISVQLHDMQESVEDSTEFTPDLEDIHGEL